MTCYSRRWKDWGQPTNRSSAVADDLLSKPDIVSETDRLVGAVGRVLLAAPISRKGFREVGLGGGSSNGDT